MGGAAAVRSSGQAANDSLLSVNTSEVMMKGRSPQRSPWKPKHVVRRSVSGGIRRDIIDQLYVNMIPIGKSDEAEESAVKTTVVAFENKPPLLAGSGITTSQEAANTNQQQLFCFQVGGAAAGSADSQGLASDT